MKISSFIAIIYTALLLLSSCGTAEKAKEANVETEETAYGNEALIEADFRAGTPGEWYKTIAGEYRLTGYGLNEKIGLDFTENPYVPFEMGPMSVTLQDVWVIDFKPNEAQKRVIFGEKDEVRIVNAYMILDNYSDMDILFNPDEATLITNTGETLEPLKLWTLTIDGNFPAGATKAVSLAWAMEDTESDLSSVRIAIDPPVAKESGAILSEPLEIEVEILPY
jgi:hypothetical protein